MWPLFSTPGKEICQKIPQYDHLPPSTSNIKVATLLPGLAYPVRAQGAVSHGVPQCAIDVVGPCVAHKVHDASDGGMPSRTLQPYRKTFTSLDCSCQPTLSNTFVCASLGFMSTHSRREQWLTGPDRNFFGGSFGGVLSGNTSLKSQQYPKSNRSSKVRSSKSGNQQHPISKHWKDCWVINQQNLCRCRIIYSCAHLAIQSGMDFWHPIIQT